MAAVPRHRLRHMWPPRRSLTRDGNQRPDAQLNPLLVKFFLSPPSPSQAVTSQLAVSFVCVPARTMARQDEMFHPDLFDFVSPLVF